MAASTTPLPEETDDGSGSTGGDGATESGAVSPDEWPDTDGLGGTSGQGAAPQGSSTSMGEGPLSSSTGSFADTDTEPGGLLAPGDLGQPCEESRGCEALGETVECCDAAQCEDTCMVACNDESDCPFEGMGCEHGYCLFPCGDELDDGDDDGGGDDGDGDDDDGGDDPDLDCAAWPGYTCQHGQRFCEND